MTKPSYEKMMGDEVNLNRCNHSQNLDRTSTLPTRSRPTALFQCSWRGCRRRFTGIVVVVVDAVTIVVFVVVVVGGGGGGGCRRQFTGDNLDVVVVLVVVVVFCGCCCCCDGGGFGVVLL